MKHLFFLALLFYSLNLSAQQWCPPGATWKYTYINLSLQGYSEIKYVGDTVINSIPCNKLERKIVSRDFTFPVPSPPSVHVLTPIYTYENSQVVFYLNDTDWDTLYNFNAGIGDRWKMTQMISPVCDSTSHVLVIDTGHVVLNGMSLKYLCVDLVFGGGFMNSPVRDTIIEKIGFTLDYMLPRDQCYGALDSHYGGAFRCYTDSSFHYKDPTYLQDCDFIVNTTGLGEDLFKELSIWPNPTQSNINIDGLPQTKSIKLKIISSDGKIILEKTENLERIDVSTLDPGVYLLSILCKGKKHVSKFIKQ